MSDNNNPYAAPSSNLEQGVVSGESRLLPVPRGVAAGRGWGWITDGFQYFKRSWGAWILGMLVGLLVVLLNIIPVIGQVIYMLVFYVIVGGVMMGCHAQSRGEPFKVSYLFAAFKKPTKLILWSVLMAVVTIVLMGLAFGSSFVGMMTMSPDDAAGAAEVMGDPSVFLIKFLVIMLIFIPLSMAIWFAPALIAINDLSIGSALKMSFSGCLKNILPFLVFGLIGMVLYIVAAIPLGLGLFVFFPTFTAASYVAYRDIFTENV